jgi:hypothetical protein
MTVLPTADPADNVDDVATLRVHRPGAIDVEHLAILLGDARWLGQPVASPELTEGTSRYLMDLVLPLPPDGRLLSLRKATLLDIGRLRPTDDGFDVDLAWRSASLAPMFPVFAGTLRIRPSGLSIEGHYAPPGGAIGRTADRMLLQIAARGTGRWFLGHLAAQLRDGVP